jgi:hypothetical protein
VEALELLKRGISPEEHLPSPVFAKTRTSHHGKYIYLRSGD